MSKEWKGNSDSVRSRLSINKDHTTKGREDDDFYATDPEALEKLLDHCSMFLQGIFFSCRPKVYDIAAKQQYAIYKNGVLSWLQPHIWECACGTGNLVDVLLQRGYYAVWTDLKDRKYGKYRGMYGRSFLDITQLFCMKYNVGVILTNPPYSLATEFIEHALEILPDNGLYIALMNITYLAGQKRYKRVYRYGNLREVYIFSKRVNCYRNNDKEEYGSQAMVDFAWYVFQKGYCGQPTIYWL